MTAAHSAFAKAGHGSGLPVRAPRHPLALLAVVVTAVLVALPLAASVRDHLADARLAALDATDRAGDFGPIEED